MKQGVNIMRIKYISEISDIIKERRKCDYTVEYSEQAKTSHDDTGKLLTAEEHSKMSEIDFSNHFQDRDALIKWYFSYLSNIDKLDIVTLMGHEINNGGISRILSIGAGPSVIENCLKEIYSEKLEILCTDYDRYIITGIKDIFPNIQAKEFDFIKDDICSLIKEFDPDTVIMIGSGCSMDEKELEAFLSKIQKTDVKRVYCFEAAIVSNLTIFKICLRKIIMLFKGRYIRGVHSFHAYYRTYKETVKIYKRAGYKYEKIRGLSSYPNAFKLYK